MYESVTRLPPAGFTPAGGWATAGWSPTNNRGSSFEPGSGFAAKSGFVPVGQTFATTAAGQLGTHTFLAPNAAVNEPLVELAGEEAGEMAFDECHFRSIGGAIQWLLRLALCLSMMSCVGRSDFSLPVLLYVYWEWSVQGSWDTTGRVQRVRGGELVTARYDKTRSLLAASPATFRGVACANSVLLVATAVDWFWLICAAATWTCALSTTHRGSRLCLSGGLRQTYGMHLLTLYLALAGAIVKTTLIAMSYAWLHVQKRSRQFLERTWL
ncbi:putative transmembrane protein [Gregarina niphandrodes]|uniref:Transmembrane protein n=1 Tax=Gregarina niphandrodes TaxID=110365 RepID=A0A023AYY2_GRENI|nr:putative transmembrane protein [Gregarina niphandrodes]EZG43495.1 putative transmembrane protein [Gregarina niphandrodes]|eukprot:XP_011133277.1 putative transmembrane protein [Gregarina niphandrodes]